jgi:dolichol-phosphate mannosyltransferase
MSVMELGQITINTLPVVWQSRALTVVIPTYNESDNLVEIVHSLFKLPLPNLRLIIVDDNSPDGTGQLADELMARYNRPDSERMAVIHRTGKAGLGTAYVAGMQRALAEGAEFVVQMDADFSHSPAYIPQMLGVILATGADVIIGSRYVPGGSLDEGWSWWRQLLSWWANLYSRFVLHIRVRDMTAGFKLWRSEALLDIGLNSIRSNGYIFQVEMAYLSEKLGYRIVEVPIHFEDRRIGQSKMDVPVKIESALRVWELRWRHRHRVQRGTTNNRRPTADRRPQPADRTPT